MVGIRTILLCTLSAVLPVASAWADNAGTDPFLQPSGEPARRASAVDPPIRTPLAVLEPKKSLDLGIIKTREIHTRQVRLTNTSGRPISVTIARVTCGCLDVTLSKEELSPGEFADLWIEIALLSPGTGTYRHSILLDFKTTDEQEERSALVPLHVSYEFQKSFSFEPGEMYPLHYETPVGTTIRRQISLINHADKGVRPTGVAFHNVKGWRLVSIEQQDSWDGRDVWRITIEGEWDEAGAHDGHMQIATNDEAVPEWFIRVTGVIHPPVRMSPGVRLTHVGQTVGFEIKESGNWEPLSVKVGDLPRGVELVSQGERLVLRALEVGRFEIPVLVQLFDSDRERTLNWSHSVRLISRHKPDE